MFPSGQNKRELSGWTRTCSFTIQSCGRVANQWMTCKQLGLEMREDSGIGAEACPASSCLLVVEDGQHVERRQDQHQDGQAHVELQSRLVHPAVGAVGCVVALEVERRRV
jgi:hypothetical protein